MKPLEIKGARVRLGLTQKYMAEHLGMSVPSYRMKEKGEIRFATNEIGPLATILELSPDQINDFLFDGELPLGTARKCYIFLL